MHHLLTTTATNWQEEQASRSPTHDYKVLTSLFSDGQTQDFFCSDPLCSCQVVKMPFFHNKTVKDIAVTEKWSVR